MPEYSKSRPFIKNTIFILAITFLIVGLANPQIGSKLEMVKREGVEIIIAIDVSNSMLAEDIKPNRLERAKQAVASVIRRLHNDKLGLIVFAGDAYTQLPVTSDYSAAKMFLNAIETDIVPVQGTSIGKAIELAMKSFSDNDSKNKAIMIITDGEDHEADAIKQAKEAAKKGVVIHTLGFGSPQGTPIPYPNRYGQKDFRKDREGNVILTKLNESLLKEIADVGNGIYVRATSSNTGLNMLLDHVKGMDKEEFESKVFADYENRFQIFFGLAFLLLILEFLVLPRKNKILKKIDIFKLKV